MRTDSRLLPSQRTCILAVALLLGLVPESGAHAISRGLRKPASGIAVSATKRVAGAPGKSTRLHPATPEAYRFLRRMVSEWTDPALIAHTLAFGLDVNARQPDDPGPFLGNIRYPAHPPQGLSLIELALSKPVPLKDDADRVMRVVKALLALNADPNPLLLSSDPKVQVGTYPSALMSAASVRDPKTAAALVEVLLHAKQKPDPNYRIFDARSDEVFRIGDNESRMGDTALKKAKLMGNHAAAALLIQAGAVDYDMDTEYALVQARDAATVRALIAKAKGPIDPKYVWSHVLLADKDGTALVDGGFPARSRVYSGYAKDLPILHALIAVTWSNGKYENRFEPHVYQKGYIPTLVLRGGADIEARDEKGRTPLLKLLDDARYSFAEKPVDSHHVVYSRWRHFPQGLRDMFDDLLDLGADVHARDTNGQDALAIALSQDYPLPAYFADRLRQVGTRKESGGGLQSRASRLSPRP